MKEIWKAVTIPEYSLYEVSNFGNVRNGNRLLKPYINRGYPSVKLYNNKKNKSVRVYRLVAMAFIENPNNYPCINHKDGNKGNTFVENLEWCTYKHNQKHAWEHGLRSFTENMRIAVTKTILNEVEKQKKKVQCLKDDRVIAMYESACEAARQINGSQPHISDCCNGKRITHKGYKWEWA